MKTHYLSTQFKYLCGAKGGKTTDDMRYVDCLKCKHEGSKQISYRIPIVTLELMNKKLKKGSHTKFVNQAILEKLSKMTEDDFMGGGNVVLQKDEVEFNNSFVVKKVGSNDGKLGRFVTFHVPALTIKPKQSLPSEYTQEL